MRWPKDWRFSFSISPSSEYSGLISFRIDWLDLLAIHGTLKSLLHPHNFGVFYSLPPQIHELLEGTDCVFLSLAGSLVQDLWL